MPAENGGAPKWDYSGLYGEQTWASHFPIGLRQSPININPNEAVFKKEYSSIPLTFTTTKTGFSALNKGNNVSFSPLDANDESGPAVNGGPLTSSYCFAETHFHWGQSNNKGCEHEINGKRFDAELHMVHRRKDEDSVPTALNRIDGLCVLGMFIEIDEAAITPSFLHHLMTSTEHIRYKSQQFENSSEKFNPYDVLQEDDMYQYYYTYEGSLTTPPLSECVRWIVFERPIKVSPDDFECLRNTFAVENSSSECYHDPFARQKECSIYQMPKIRDNYRSCCNVNGRIVGKSF